MLSFYENRGGKNLSSERTKTLEKAKDILREKEGKSPRESAKKTVKKTVKKTAKKTSAKSSSTKKVAKKTTKKGSR